MAYEILFNNIGSQLAAEDLRLKQFRFVKLNSSAKFILGTVAGERIDGVLQDTPNTDEPANVVTLNGSVSKIVVGAGVTLVAGDLIASDADGEAKVAVSTEFAAGKALEGGPAGAVISFLADNYGIVA